MNCAATALPEANRVLSIAQELLAESLVAFYLHGSAVTSGLRHDSDIDLLAVIAQPITFAARANLTNELLGVSGPPGCRGGLRPIELIMFLRADLTPPTYPARYEFIYGEWLRSEFEAGEEPKPVCDPEQPVNSSPRMWLPSGRRAVFRLSKHWRSLLRAKRIWACKKIIGAFRRKNSGARRIHCPSRWRQIYSLHFTVLLS